MSALRSAKSIGIYSLALGLLLATPFCAQARMQCVSGGEVAMAHDSRRVVDNVTIEGGRFDVVPCAEEAPQRPADGGQSRAKSTEEAASFVAWIAGKTDWTARAVPPIRFVPYAELVSIFSGGKGTEYHVESLYSETDHTIYLPDSWRADNLRDRSILLHELVHHLQYLNKVKADCPSEYEWQAIDLQLKWLGEQGVDDPLDLLGLDPRILLMLRGCE